MFRYRSLLPVSSADSSSCSFPAVARRNKRNVRMVSVLYGCVYRDRWCGAEGEGVTVDGHDI